MPSPFVPACAELRPTVPPVVRGSWEPRMTSPRAVRCSPLFATTRPRSHGAPVSRSLRRAGLLKNLGHRCPPPPMQEVPTTRRRSRPATPGPSMQFRKEYVKFLNS